MRETDADVRQKESGGNVRVRFSWFQKALRDFTGVRLRRQEQLIVNSLSAAQK